MHIITHYHLIFFFGGGYPACSSSHDHDHDDNDVVSDDDDDHHHHDHDDDDDPSWSGQMLAFDCNISNKLLPQKKTEYLIPIGHKSYQE
jgi:hypothetical protein